VSYTHTLFHVLGGLTLAAFSLAAMALACGWVVDRCGYWSGLLLDRLRQDARREAIREVGGLLMGQCHWFGESPDAYLALEEVGRDLGVSGWLNASAVRDRWRERRTAAPAGGTSERLSGYGPYPPSPGSGGG
jgi:hypothetical protein